MTALSSDFIPVTLTVQASRASSAGVLSENTVWCQEVTGLKERCSISDSSGGREELLSAPTLNSTLIVFFTCSRIVLNSEGEEENKKSLISLLEKTISSQDLPAAVLSFFISVFSQSAPPEDSTQLFIWHILSFWTSSWRDVSLKCDKLEKQNEDRDIWVHEALSGRRALKQQHSQQKDQLNCGGEVWADIWQHLHCSQSRCSCLVAYGGNINFHTIHKCSTMCTETSCSCIKLMKVSIERIATTYRPCSYPQKIKDDLLQTDSAAPPAEAHTWSCG